jgi:hypothetical protein
MRLGASIASPWLVCGVAVVAACSASSRAASSDGADAGLDAASGDGEGVGPCPDEAPDACPTPEPSYVAQVQPILQDHCYECHADGGIITASSNVDLGSYEAVYAERGAVLSQLSFCTMPPSVYAAGLPAPVAPTPADRATVLSWLKCHAPDN